MWWIITIGLLFLLYFCADDDGDEESENVLHELENIDDDCAKHGIQFVKIDDPKVSKEYGIDDVSILANIYSFNILTTSMTGIIFTCVDDQVFLRFLIVSRSFRFGCDQQCSRP